MTPLTKCAVAAILSAGFAASSAAQVSDDVVKFGVIADMSGPYSAIAGAGLVRAVCVFHAKPTTDSTRIRPAIRALSMAPTTVWDYLRRAGPAQLTAARLRCPMSTGPCPVP